MIVIQCVEAATEPREGSLVDGMLTLAALLCLCSPLDVFTDSSRIPIMLQRPMFHLVPDEGVHWAVIPATCCV